MQQQRIALHARQLVIIVSHEFDVLSTARRGAQREHLLQHGVDADGAPRETARAREHEQVPDDLRSAIRFAVNRLHFAADLLGKRAGDAQQLQMTEHALQRIVEFVGDAGDELTECRQFLGLCETAAQFLALSLQPRLRREVARDDHVPDHLAVVVEQIGDRHHERPLEQGVEQLAGRRRVDTATGVARLQIGDPPAQLRADMAGERLVNQFFARSADACGERLIDVRQVTAAIGDRDQMCNRIERVLQLAARPDEVVEQLHVLNRAGELAAELVGAIEQVQLAARLDPDALEHDRAERSSACRAAAPSPWP